MRIERFEDLDSWKEARELVRGIYAALTPCRDFGFRDQMQRAGVSIMANIAEGFGRESCRERIQFSIIARGSAAEVKSLAYVALDLGYLREEEFMGVVERCDRTKTLLNGFIRYLNTCAGPK